MNRFKKWLIHKLGGISKEETIEFKTQNVSLQTIKAKYCISENELLVMDRLTEDRIKRELAYDLLHFIQPEYICVNDFDNRFIMAKLELPSKYIKLCEEDLDND